ncbi:MAG: 16S rRNA (uracil(1498)-N(3))-methyltransferase [Clostridiaceae bacterium]|jgi:16S rRNA (uracil1498-N3)-methyltransferase|nr:16S rRNA (uracil(1498)-N(3))-methyltransferase [Clostridiaceae bacterium]
MSRFFVKTIPADLQNGRIIITGEDVKHIAGVLRARTGDPLVLCDAAGTDYDAVIEQISKENVITRIIDRKENHTEPPVDITLFQGIPKADKMDLIIQKCVELGVNRFVPVTTARSVVRFRDARDAAVKAVRWGRIALEAAKQCGRGRIPVVEEPVGVDAALKLAHGYDLMLLPYEEETEGSLRSVLHSFGRSIAGNGAVGDNAAMRRIAIFIGPEGGFERTETEKAVRSGFRSVKLGPRILRTETAGIAVSSIVMYELGDMGG